MKMPARDAFDLTRYGTGRWRRAGKIAAVRGAVWLAVLLCLCVAGANPLFAQQEQQRDAAAAKEAKTQPWARSSVTHHVIEIGGRRLKYTARAGMVDVKAADAKTRGRMFFVAYTEDGVNPRSRPLTFVFNGGPGAASAYLHLLALGPRMAALNDDGSIPSPPIRLVNNPATWLDFTDLVFVDPVGTGYSRAIGPEKGNDAKQKQTQKPGRGNASRFWNVKGDLDSLAEFVRLYLTGAQRWASPKFLAGESYGGFRAAILPNRMASKPGVRLNGVVLISPVLEFSARRFSAYRLLPWATMLPAYAATALYHHKSSVSGKLPDVLREAEGFAMGDYLTWLARQKASDKDPVVQKLSDYLGLSRDVILRHHGRISRSVFAKRLLRDSGRVVSPYDGTITEVDPHPDSPFLEGDDPVLNGLSAPLTTAFNEYVRNDLNFETELPYLVLNPTTSRKWRWESDGHFRRLGAASDLKEAMSLNPNLKVFIVHGAYDMVTPYLASKFVVRHMDLDPSIASNVTFKVYDGGHMPYTHVAIRAALHQDARTFFHNATKGTK